jgi:chondroitin-sulfate-ABC endolyase/exolyase
MKQTSIFILLLLLYSTIQAQHYSFETGTAAPFQATDPGLSQLSVVSAPYKDGSAALEWNWTAPTSLMIDTHINLRNFRDGVAFWVYNETPHPGKLTGEFRDTNNQVRYQFQFGLNYTGWRICRIGSRYMNGNKTISTNLKLHLLTPSGVDQGRLYIDRFTFMADVGYQNAPDAQQPTNNEERYINHWNSLWKWESELTHDLAVSPTLTAEQETTLTSIEAAIADRLPRAANSSVIANATALFTASTIRNSDTFWIGSPLVVKPDKTASDISLAELGTMMMGLAQDALFNNSTTSRQHYIDLWDFAHDQGFAYGSAMGNNHHYGYETRQIFQSAYMMRDHLSSTGRIEDVAATLSFWSGLPEARNTFNNTRDGIVDTWNTLLFPRLIAAMLTPEPTQRYRALASLVRWMSSSLEFTPGNMGGLKPDGTVFHHAGHYPAYAVGGFEGIGNFIATLAGSSLNLTHSARTNLATSLHAMARYTHLTDWSIGLSGRHPHQGGMTSAVIEAFGLLALLGGIDDPTQAIDPSLAGEYLRLQSTDTPLKQHLSTHTAASTPSGFFVYNHAAAGVHRFGNNMVNIKGYNSDVWGSEIYTNDNRYGRYQSYGAVEIFNEGNPVSRTNSRFNEAGWDWNRLPGTTTIHLPLDLLESPITTTLMARSKEDFAGASSLQGRYGIFGMKLWEENHINNTNYTRDFKARKSVFAFDKRIVCIGTGISNSNTQHPTQTTLYQQSIIASTDRMSVNGTFQDASGFHYDSEETDGPSQLSDLSGNYYRVSGRHRIIVEGKQQHSRHNKTRESTTGNFLTARIDHGTSPSNATYEYMIMLRPTPMEQRRWNTDPGYRVLQADHAAHSIHDTISGVTAIVSYESHSPATGILRHIPAETLVMIQQHEAQTMTLSICDPSLRMPVKTNNSDNTAINGPASTRHLTLQGNWEMSQPDKAVNISYENQQTQLMVTLQPGMPTEITLRPIGTSTSAHTTRALHISTTSNQLTVQGMTTAVSIFDTTGRRLATQDFQSEEKKFQLEKGKLYLLVAHLPNHQVQTHKFYL